jgi:hypothetical protein
MKAEVTISNIYWNKGLSNFFFREQALSTLKELIKRSATDGALTLGELDDATEGMDINDVEETFYSESVEYCADEFGIELEEEEDEDDD